MNFDWKEFSLNLTFPNCMQIARKNYNLALIVEDEPQIKASSAAPLEGADHRKVRKERKAQPQCRTPIQRIFTDPRISASTVAPVDVAHTYGSRYMWRFHRNTQQSTQRAQSIAARIFATFTLFAVKGRNYLSGLSDINSAYVSAFHHVCSSLKNKASGVSASIRVHPRFFKNVIFQTGLTGSTGYVFNPVHPVILSNLKCQLPALQQSAKLLERVK